MPTHTTLSGRVTGARKVTSDRGKTGNWAARALQRPEQERGAGWEQLAVLGMLGRSHSSCKFCCLYFFRSINHQSQCENQGQLSFDIRARFNIYPMWVSFPPSGNTCPCKGIQKVQMGVTGKAFLLPFLLVTCCSLVETVSYAALHSYSILLLLSFYTNDSTLYTPY